jgi:hypothetical protein
MAFAIVCLGVLVVFAPLESSTGTTGCPAFNTFCLMLLLDVTIVDGKLVCWGRRPDRQLPPNGHTRSAPGRPRDRPVRGMARTRCLDTAGLRFNRHGKA